MTTIVGIEATITPDMDDPESPRNAEGLENQAREFIARHHGQVGDFHLEEADEGATVPWVRGNLEVSAHLFGRVRENGNSLRLEGLGVIIDLEISDEYVKPEVCRFMGFHLASCDKDGYCHFCGEQE